MRARPRFIEKIDIFTYIERLFVPYQVLLNWFYVVCKWRRKLEDYPCNMMSKMRALSLSPLPPPPSIYILSAYSRSLDLLPFLKWLIFDVTHCRRMKKKIQVTPAILWCSKCSLCISLSHNFLLAFLDLLLFFEWYLIWVISCTLVECFLDTLLDLPHSKCLLFRDNVSIKHGLKVSPLEKSWIVSPQFCSLLVYLSIGVTQL